MLLPFPLWSFTTSLYEFSPGNVFNLRKSCWFSGELFTTTGGWRGFCTTFCIGPVVSLCLVITTLDMLVSSCKTLLLTSSQFKTLKWLWDKKLFLVTSKARCKKGEFVTLRPNEFRYVIATLSSDVWKDVELEPSLLTLNGEEQTMRVKQFRRVMRYDLTFVLGVSGWMDRKHSLT